MNKNKLGQETTWELYKVNFDEGRTVYFWVDSNRQIQYERTISKSGWMPVPDNYFNSVKSNLSFVRNYFHYMYEMSLSKASHKMTDEEMSKGWLLL